MHAAIHYQSRHRHLAAVTVDPAPSPLRTSLTPTSPQPIRRHEVFLCVLTFLYTGQPRDIDAEMAVEVLGVANLYSIDPLKRICAGLITKSVSVANVSAILQAADTYQVVTLRAHCICYMVEHFAEVIRTEGFADLVSAEGRSLVLQFLEEASGRLSPHAAIMPAAQHHGD